MLKQFMLATTLGILASAAFANDAARAEARQVVELKDGSTVYTFQGGKMAMEDRLGRAVRMDEGTRMETKNGQMITMRGDEVARLDALLKQDQRP